jgi:hypothetical protein
VGGKHSQLLQDARIGSKDASRANHAWLGRRRGPDYIPPSSDVIRARPQWRGNGIAAAAAAAKLIALAIYIARAGAALQLGLNDNAAPVAGGFSSLLLLAGYHDIDQAPHPGPSSICNSGYHDIDQAPL